MSFGCHCERSAAIHAGMKSWIATAFGLAMTQSEVMDCFTSFAMTGMEFAMTGMEFARTGMEFARTGMVVRNDGNVFRNSGNG